MEAPNFRMDGRVALVTGAGRGIGLGIARALAANGCAVAIQDVEPDVAAAEADAIRRAGGRAIALGGDIGDVTLPPRLVEQTVRELGGLHVLVNNAAIQSEVHWLNLGSDEMAAQLRANLIAPVLLCQQAIPIFRRQRRGRVLNIGSVQQKTGNPDMLAYAASKAALENATKSLARDLAPDGITVNLLAPGWFNTWRNREHFRTPEDLRQKGARYVPLGRVGEPEDCAGVALMLCSDAGAYVTGQTIFVDGGMTLK